MQRSSRLQAWWPGYCKDVEEHLRRCPKCTEIKTFKQTKIHTWPKKGGAMDKGSYGSFTYLRHWFILDLSRFLLRLAESNKGER